MIRPVTPASGFSTTWLAVVLNWKVSALALGAKSFPARQRDSMAAPVWQAARATLLYVSFLEMRTRLKGQDWLNSWARAGRAKVKRPVMVERRILTDVYAASKDASLRDNEVSMMEIE